VTTLGVKMSLDAENLKAWLKLATNMASDIDEEAYKTHALIVCEYAVRRKCVDNLSDLMMRSMDGEQDAGLLVSQLGILSENLTNKLNFLGADKKTKAQVLSSVLDMMLQDEKEKPIFSGFRELDTILEYSTSTNIIIAARPSMGKTLMTIQIARMLAKSGQPCAFWALEGNDNEIWKRAVIQTAAVTRTEVQNRSEEVIKKMTAAADELHDIPFEVNSGSATAVEISFALAEMAAKGTKYLILDHIGHIDLDENNRTNKTDWIGKAMKKISNAAAKHGIKVIYVSQLSRKVEERSNKRPILSDLRDSGEIEQIADIVLFLYRDEYYKILEDEEGNSTKNILEVIVAKNRNAGLATVKIGVNLEKLQLYSIQDKEDFGSVNEYQTSQPVSSIINSMRGASDLGEDIPF
jgi:replicative DNA helicase